MIIHNELEHRFMRNIPEKLEPGVLYISMEYGMVSHSCACGCGEEVTTPLTPTDWHLVYDGEAVTLNPSVGNWNLACRSHYVIRRGRVIEAGPWSEEEVAAERARDRATKARYYGGADMSAEVVEAPTSAPVPAMPAQGWLGRLKRWLFG
ncbi:DUF6527 family protein [Novosphingobium rosa]|uniref:DUF6527 family protein n=1 Tax=Novosphingobium rosa TaxID=76978 RepID=UPI0008357F06|nr:DUF6527 family protein [Novosphingobium rosa]